MPDLADQLSVLLGGLHPQQGWQDTFQLPAVGAGIATIARKIDGIAWERLTLAKVRLVTSAVVANRSVQAAFLDGDGNAVHVVPISGAVPASTTIDCYVSTVGAFQLGTSGVSNSLIPDLLLPSGWTFQFQASGLDVADQLSNARVVVQRFPTNAVRATAD